MLELKPWHDAALAHWLLDCDFAMTDEQRAEVTRVTGNWPLLLREFWDRQKMTPFTGKTILRSWNLISKRKSMRPDCSMPSVSRTIVTVWS